jgi:hypothetical protein
MFGRGHERNVWADAKTNSTARRSTAPRRRLCSATPFSQGSCLSSTASGTQPSYHRSVRVSMGWRLLSVCAGISRRIAPEFAHTTAVCNVCLLCVVYVSCRSKPLQIWDKKGTAVALFCEIHIMASAPRRFVFCFSHLAQLNCVQINSS